MDKNYDNNVTFIIVHERILRGNYLHAIEVPIQPLALYYDVDKRRIYAT